MSYALRNSLVLVVLLIVAWSVGGYWIRVRQSARIEVLARREKDLKSELDNINSVLAIYDTTRMALDRLKARWQARRQVVPASDGASQTLAYLNGLSKLKNAAVSFNFQYEGRKDEANYSTHQYALEGDGRFRNLYTFLWQLEHGRRFYTVDHLSISREDPAASSGRGNRLSFRMVFRSFFEPESRVEEAPLSTELLAPDRLAGDPFRPLITKSIARNREGLFEADGSRLRGLAGDKAYLVDREGRMHLLKQGDRVHLGRLSKIDVERKRVEFTLNEGGILRRHTLRMEINAAKP